MKRVVWANDIHLDFPGEAAVGVFLEDVAGRDPDVVLLGGDISTAPSIVTDLRRFEARLDVPVCFVLGNHDYYHGSVDGVRKRIDELTRDSKRLHWLNTSGVFPLAASTALVGHDGWGDARVGNPVESPVQLSDFYLIDELAGKSRAVQVEVMRALGDEAAAHVDAVLPLALSDYANVIVLTHVPPFREASWYGGEPSNDDWAPFFTCKAMGDRLLHHASRHPRARITVLCGHTHGHGEWDALPNLKVITGGAEYRKPAVQAILEVE